MALLLVFLFKFLVFCFAIGIFVSVIGAIFAFKSLLKSKQVFITKPS